MLLDDVLEEIGEGIFQRFVIAVCGIAVLAEAIATASMPFAMMLVSCDLGLSLEQMLGLNCIFFVGMAIGGYWLGSVSDVCGRKYILSTTSIITFVGCFVASFAQCVIMLFVSLLILGIGLGGNHSATRIFVVEVIPKSCRGSRLIALDLFSSVGYISAVGLSCLLVPSIMENFKGNYVRFNSWRIIYGLSGLLSIFSACLMSIFPASPRWLLGKKQEEDAVDVLRKIYTVNRIKHEESFPGVQLDPITHVSVRTDNMLYQCSSHFVRIFRYLWTYTMQLFARKYLKTTVTSLIISVFMFDGPQSGCLVFQLRTFLFQRLVFMNVWLGIGVPQASMTNCTLLGGSPVYAKNLTALCRGPPVIIMNAFEVNVYLSLCSLVLLLMVFPVDKIARKFLLLGSILISGASSIAFVLSPIQNLRLCLAFAVLSFSFVSEAIFRIIVFESYPTIFRGTAYGFIKFFARIVLIALIALLRAPCLWSFTAFGIIGIVLCVASALLPNHNQEPMED